LKINNTEEAGTETALSDIDKSKWRMSVVNSFRLSRDLLHMIKEECRFRNLDFSSYARHAAMFAMKYPHYATGAHILFNREALLDAGYGAT
jgi:hypothetical protein